MPSLQAARALILISDESTTDERWANETPYLANLIQTVAANQSIILDYGCGIGRLAKELLNRRSLMRVIGTDISPSMRELAIHYVASDRFRVCPPEALRALRPVVDLAIAVWVLQHAARPARDLDLIKRVLRPGGRLFVVNSTRRLVPTTRGWGTDGIDVQALIAERFTVEKMGTLDPARVGSALARDSWWGLYQTN